MRKSKKCKETGLLLKLMIVCVTLSIIMLGIVAYDKIIKTNNDDTCECQK
jgi:hypothetical protein